MKKIGLLFVALLLIIAAGCGGNTASNSNSDSSSSSDSNSSESAESSLIEGVPEGVQGDIKIAVVRNLPSDDHTNQFLEGTRVEGESFGFTVDTFISNGDDAKFQDLVAQVIQKNYDGIIISHGKDSYSYNMIKPAIDKGIKVVTFDTIAEKDGETLEGITSTAQNDFLLAEMSLSELVAQASDGAPPRILKITVAGIPPLDNRDVIYKQFEEEGKFETLEVVGPSNLQNVQGEVSTRVNAILSKYPKGQIDAIWGAWDELAKGAYTALKDNKRDDVKLISIDVSNQDINFMTEEGSNWVATAAVDPKLIGIMNMRLLAKKLAGEETPETYQLEPSLIKQDILTPETTMNTLNEVIEGWGESNDHNEPWMDTLRSHFGK